MSLLEKLVREEANKIVERKLHAHVSDALNYLDRLFWSDADSVAVAKLEMAGFDTDRLSEYDYRLIRAEAIVQSVQKGLEEFRLRPLSDLHRYACSSGRDGTLFAPSTVQSSLRGPRASCAASTLPEGHAQLPTDSEQAHQQGDIS